MSVGSFHIFKTFDISVSLLTSKLVVYLCGQSQHDWLKLTSKEQIIKKNDNIRGKTACGL